MAGQGSANPGRHAECLIHVSLLARLPPDCDNQQ